MGKWQYREEGKRVSKLILAEKETEELIQARDFIKELLDLRKSEKLEKTYIEGTRKAIDYNDCNKVFVDYKLDGTATGRLSCTAYNAEKSMGVSFHTLPRETENNVRSFFVAPDGYSFLTVDYAAMELRVLSHIAKEQTMQHAFKTGKDLHTYTACLLFNKKDKDVTKEERQIAKTVSFLIVYGGGAFNLSETMANPLAKAERVIDNYKTVYPGIFRFMDFINAYIKRHGYAYTIFGRRRNLPVVYSGDFKIVNRALRQGLNFTIQSSSSDILLCSLIGIHNRFNDLSMKSKIISTVHDSIEIISPHEEIKEACEIVYDEMVNYPFIKENFDLVFDVPFGIETLVGTSFGDGVEVEYEDGQVTNLDDVKAYANSSSY